MTIVDEKPPAQTTDRPAHTRSQWDERTRLCIIITIGRSVQVLYAGRLEFLQAAGFDVTVVCASSELDHAIRSRGVNLYTVGITRSITPWRDLSALWKVYRFLRRKRFDVVEVSTPKAALIGSIAARLAGVECLIHLLRGLVYEGQRGLSAFLLRQATRIPCRLADVTFAVSRSVVEQAQCDGLCGRGRLRIIGMGSSNGVDLRRFAGRSEEKRAAVRAKYGIAAEAVVLTFVGRMTRDKGIVELAEAFRILRKEIPHLVLLLVGEYERRDQPPSDTIAFLSTEARVRHVGWQEHIVPFLAASDIFILPTHREGLGNALLEAAAMELPTITTNATGARDASVDGVTGLRVPVGDVSKLADAIRRLASDPRLRRQMGVAGRQWVAENFDRPRIWERYAAEYRRVLASCRQRRSNRC